MASACRLQSHSPTEFSVMVSCLHFGHLYRTAISLSFSPSSIYRGTSHGNLTPYLAAIPGGPWNVSSFKPCNLRRHFLQTGSFAAWATSWIVSQVTQMQGIRQEVVSAIPQSRNKLWDSYPQRHCALYRLPIVSNNNDLDVRLQYWRVVGKTKILGVYGHRVLEI